MNKRKVEMNVVDIIFVYFCICFLVVLLNGFRTTLRKKPGPREVC